MQTINIWLVRCSLFQFLVLVVPVIHALTFFFEAHLDVLHFYHKKCLVVAIFMSEKRLVWLTMREIRRGRQGQNKGDSL